MSFYYYKSFQNSSPCVDEYLIDDIVLMFRDPKQIIDEIVPPTCDPCEDPKIEFNFDDKTETQDEKDNNKDESKDNNKICSKCKITKSKTQFYKKRDTLTSHCIPCIKSKKRQTYHENKNKKKQ